MYESLRSNKQLCWRQLQRSRLLHEEHLERCSSRVSLSNTGTKGTRADYVLSDGVVGVVVVSREPAPTPSPPAAPIACPTTFSCPGNDGCTIRGTDPQVYALSCSTDYYGGDFTSLWADSLPVCAQACVRDSKCVAASFNGGSGAGTCYLKDKNNGAGASENADGKSSVLVPPKT